MLCTSSRTHCDIKDNKAKPSRVEGEDWTPWPEQYMAAPDTCS